MTTTISKTPHPRHFNTPQLTPKRPVFSSESLKICLHRIQCTELTLPNTDLQGRTLQLWKYKDSLTGTLIDEKGHVRFFSGRRIHNPCFCNSLDSQEILFETKPTS